LPRSETLSRLLLLLSFGWLQAAQTQAAAVDPAALHKDIEALKLDGRAVSLKNVKLGAGLATLQFTEGILLPASPVGGKTIEMVFLGKGRITLEPPNPIEAGQLELFTGQSRLDAEFKEAVLVIGLDPAVDALLRKPAVQADAETVRRGEALYQEWRQGKEREIYNVERGMLLDGLEDPSASGYFVAWLRGAEPGDFMYLVEPASREQVTLGRFVPIDATEKEKRRLIRQIGREQKKGRLIGLELDDLGQWDTWLAAPLPGAAGPRPGAAAFEPTKYTLDVAVDSNLRLSGKARIDLTPVIPGSRAVVARLPFAFQVSRVTDGAGADLYHRLLKGELTIVLPRAPTAGEAATVVVHYEGNAIEKEWNLFALADTENWYPHAGQVDRATFDVTFHWPKDLELMAGGRLMDGGQEAGGIRWERRVLDRPSLGYSFELGNYKVETVKVGHVDVRFAFGSGSKWTGRGVKEDVIKSVTDSLLYFEETFGPYPFDELTVATAPRGFSQSLPGFITLSDFLLNDAGMWNRYFGLEDRRLVIAHEVSHQWWGNQVGWASYRDQWISEALASYSALLYGRAKLDDKLSGLNLTEGWQQAVTAALPDGSPIESAGPLVLGGRLDSSRAGGAYQPIVYKKGAVVVDMLARTLGEDNFPKVLRQVAKGGGGRTISTEDLFAMIEQVTSTDLDAFAEQYVYGTGLPEVLYGYRIEKAGKGWVVKGTARQRTPHRFRYKVVTTPAGTFDVMREGAKQVDVKTSTLVVPVTVAVYDPKGGRAGDDGANATIRGNILLRGESTEFAIDVEHEPKKLWLDRDRRVFGYFMDESQHPKRALYQDGLSAAAAGDLTAAASLYERALETKEALLEDTSNETWGSLQRLQKAYTASIELSRARLFLDRGDEKKAEELLDRAERGLAFRDAGEMLLLRARLEIRRGEFEKAYRRLRKNVIATEKIDSTEAFALLAIAARQTGNKEEFEKAQKGAKASGADLTALTGNGTGK